MPRFVFVLLLLLIAGTVSGQNYLDKELKKQKRQKLSKVVNSLEEQVDLTLKQEKKIINVLAKTIADEQRIKKSQKYYSTTYKNMLLKKLYTLEDRIILKYLNKRQEKIYKRNKEDINPNEFLTPGTELTKSEKEKER